MQIIDIKGRGKIFLFLKQEFQEREILLGEEIFEDILVEKFLIWKVRLCYIG